MIEDVMASRRHGNTAKTRCGNFKSES